MEYLLDDNHIDDELKERYEKWIRDGKPGPSTEERLADIDISRELKILGLKEEDVYGNKERNHR